jgi:uncharacterized protein YndB with AHSA1/START domain
VNDPEKPHEAVLIRRYPHPVVRVFRAWSVPRHIEGWLRPSLECRLRVEVFDFREGGDFVFNYEWGDNASPVRGRFRTIVPEQTLVYSWSPQPPDPYAGRETVVSVHFSAIASGTEILIRHTLFPDRAMRDRHQAGWASALDLLNTLFESDPQNFP